jgi:hypothetical protein
MSKKTIGVVDRETVSVLKTKNVKVNCHVDILEGTRVSMQFKNANLFGTWE